MAGSQRQRGSQCASATRTAARTCVAATSAPIGTILTDGAARSGAPAARLPLSPQSAGPSLAGLWQSAVHAPDCHY
jgi:hypothetical protein